jgi:hypothetical protein
MKAVLNISTIHKSFKVYQLYKVIYLVVPVVVDLNKQVALPFVVAYHMLAVLACHSLAAVVGHHREQLNED